MLTSHSLTLRQVFELGKFSPAKVQREFQWQTGHVVRLYDDLLGAFERMGLDPGDATLDEILSESSNADGPMEAAEPAPEGEVDDTDAQPTPVVRVVIRQRTRPDAYCLGTLILLRTGRMAEQNYLVYDGLQRLTTLSILLSQLRDSWKDIAARTPEIASLLFSGAGSDGDKPTRR